MFSVGLITDILVGLVGFHYVSKGIDSISSGIDSDYHEEYEEE